MLPTKPKKGEVATHGIDGQKTRGVLRGEEHGCPVVCYRLQHKSGQRATLGGVVQSSENDVENETEDLFAAVQNGLKFKAR